MRENRLESSYTRISYGERCRKLILVLPVLFPVFSSFIGSFRLLWDTKWDTQSVHPFCLLPAAGGLRELRSLF